MTLELSIKPALIRVSNASIMLRPGLLGWFKYKEVAIGTTSTT